MTIEAGWNKYQRMIPSEAPRVQRRETKKAFYSGAVVALHLFRHAIADMNPEAVQEYIDSLAKEAHLFSEQVSTEEGDGDEEPGHWQGVWWERRREGG